MKFVDSKGGPNSELSLHFAKLQDELLSTRKLSIAQRVLQLQSVERSMKSVKHMLGDNAKRTGLNFDCSGSFKAHIVDFVRNAVESLNLSPHTIVLDPHMKLEGSDEFLKIAQNIFSRFVFLLCNLCSSIDL